MSIRKSRFSLVRIALFAIGLWLLSGAALAVAADTGATEVVPLELCHELPVTPGETLLGVLTPDQDPTLSVRLFELGLAYDDLAVCREPWERVLPQWAPWSPEQGFESIYAWAVFGAAFVAVLILSQLLPRAWRRQVTLLGLFGVVGATWVLGVAGLRVVNAAGLPQRLIYGDMVAVQGTAGGNADATKWLAVRGIRDLDRELIARGLHPARLESGIQVAQVDGGDKDVVTTGRQRIQDGARQIEVVESPAKVAPTEIESTTEPSTVAAAVVEVATPMSDAAVDGDSAQPVASEEADGNVAVADDAGVAKPVDASEPKPVHTAWVDADNLLFNFAPAIIDPVGKSYRVRQALNLRASPGIQHERRSVLPRGSLVEVIGPTQGDWWKVRSADGDEGWVSSLWLRVPAE